MAIAAAIRVFLKPRPIRSHTWEKFSLEGSISGPHSSIENWPFSSRGR